MWYLYLDESGDLGFDFVNQKPSRFFTVAILALEGAEHNRRLLKAAKITLRRKFNIRKVKAEELKGSKCPLRIKKYFYSKLAEIPFALYAITLNKMQAFEQLTRDRERVYNYMVRLLLDQIPFSDAGRRIEIIIDRSKTKRNIAEFNEYILRQVKSKFDPKVPLYIYHYDSKQNFGLQAIDMFCWGIFRKYEQQDQKWYDVFKQRIVYDERYL